MKKLLKASLLLSTVLLMTSNVNAAVSVEEAEALKTTLTPLGGEKAGNADGSIPAWDGGFKGQLTGPSVGEIPAQIFADEKPLYKVTKANMSEYDTSLSEGTKALLNKFPETFRLDVYPTHRTSTAGQSIYENTFKNATRCEAIENGYSLKGCAGGIPFPIPKTGVEAMWNYLLRVESPAARYSFKNIVGNSDGSHTLATRNEINVQYPAYYADQTPENWSGEYWLFRFNTLEPPFKAGESLVVRDGIDMNSPRKAWQYLVGQRRVRRAPTVAYDTPDFVASGANYFDEVQGLMGALDRYEWKLVGKKEMLVPYNTNSFLAYPPEEALSAYHLNPDHLRWEKHRVWEIEANVASGKRHAVPKRRYYLDEDTWLITLMDGYDSEGTLWRTSQVPSYVFPKMPGNITKTATVFNLQANTMSVIQLLNGENYEIVEPKSESFYTGAAVAAEGVR